MIQGVVLLILRVYKKGISPYLPHRCRFYPSCSEYTRQAISRYGLLQGIWLGGWRLLRCGPWHPGGYDPVK